MYTRICIANDSWTISWYIKFDNCLLTTFFTGTPGAGSASAASTSKIILDGLTS